MQKEKPKKIKDITDIEEVNKICKQPNTEIKSKVICFDCPLFLGFCCYANIMHLINQELEVDTNV